jgi:ribosomal protein L22
MAKEKIRKVESEEKKEIVESPTEEIKKEVEEKKLEIKTSEKPEEKKLEDKKSEKKEEKKKIQKIKKTEVFVYSTIPCSMKESRDICKFIMNKSIDVAISDLDQVMKIRKVVPMKGEVAHRKGRGIMAGRYPKKTAQYFIMSLKTLKGNANNHDVENPVIVEAYSNKAYEPRGKFGSVRKKRTHIKITAKELKEKINLGRKK